MSDEKTIKVRCAEGRLCPIHPTDYPVAGGGQFLLPPGDEIEVRWSPAIRRRIRSGDLIPVTPPDANAATPPAKLDTMERVQVEAPLTMPAKPTPKEG